VLNLKQYPGDWRITVADAKQELEALEYEYFEDVFSTKTFSNQIQAVQKDEEEYHAKNKKVNIPHWTLLQYAMLGDWESTLCLVGGAANTGKTAWMANLAMHLIEGNPDICILFQTIDDTFHQFLTRLVCLRAIRIVNHITLNQIKDPNGNGVNRTLRAARDQAYQEILALAKAGRLVVKSGEERGGNTLKFTHDWIKYNKEKHPGMRIVHFLDNFHRLLDFSGMKEERVRYKKLSQALKNIDKEEGITTWATVEYTKAASILRPNNSDISESVAMEYDANFIMHLYNEVHIKKEDAQLFHMGTVLEGTTERIVKLPTVEGIVGKNKITGFKGSLFWDFYPDRSSFRQVDYSVITTRKNGSLINSQGIQEVVIPQNVGTQSYVGKSFAQKDTAVFGRPAAF